MSQLAKALIFDLDSCLSAANEVGDDLFKPAFDAVRAANRGAISETSLAQAFSDCWRFPFDAVAEKYCFSKEMTDARWREFEEIEVRVTMHGYGDLHELEDLSPKLFLVTSGFRRLQESKIRALGIGSLFTGIFIDAIDEDGPKGKERIFSSILRQHQLRPYEVFVVGDNPDSEIAPGNKLGMTTIQVLRPGVPAGRNAKYQIHSLGELKKLPGICAAPPVQAARA